jgi:RNA polymerase sigma-70 factor, ECF subfamily
MFSLPEKQRMVLSLCYLQSLSNKGGADVLYLKVKTMESLLMRGRKVLAKNLANTAQGLLNLD